MSGDRLAGASSGLNPPRLSGWVDVSGGRYFVDFLLAFADFVAAFAALGCFASFGFLMTMAGIAKKLPVRGFSTGV